MKLLIVHYHLRPGGVRRIIETAVLEFVRKRSIEEIAIATGEACDHEWISRLRQRARPTPVKVYTSESLNYLSEQASSPSIIETKIRRFLEGILKKDPHWIIWAHNLSVGRNLILARELARYSRATKTSLIFHHHDWWFDNRWQRWREIRRSGFRTLDQTARAVLSSGKLIQHIAINKGDALVLRRDLGHQSHWLPNPTQSTLRNSKARQAARQWMTKHLRIDQHPVWILPCRLLRRKNIAEAILLTRWLRPEAWLITTGGISSKDEFNYASRLAQAIKTNDWKVKLSALTHTSPPPEVSHLMAASEAAIFTSLQEGFGLPYLEAAAAGCPLIARKIPGIMSDLGELKFEFPQTYNEILVNKDLFDLSAEKKRQYKLWIHWRKSIAGPCRKHLQGGKWLERNQIPFSRLTLTAQLQVLTQPPLKSWQDSQAANPFLIQWRSRLLSGRSLISTQWPKDSLSPIEPRNYANRLIEIFTSLKGANRKKPASALSIQEAFIQKKFRSSNLYPLLWAPKT